MLRCDISIYVYCILATHGRRVFGDVLSLERPNVVH